MKTLGYDAMELKELIQERLKELDWSVYRLSQEVARLRSKRLGEEIDPMRVQSTVRKVVNSPENARWNTISEVIEALGGNLALEWPRRLSLTR